MTDAAFAKELSGAAQFLQQSPGRIRGVIVIVRAHAEAVAVADRDKCLAALVQVDTVQERRHGLHLVEPGGIGRCGQDALLADELVCHHLAAHLADELARQGAPGAVDVGT